MIDAQLASYGTARQLEYLEAVEAHGSNRKAGKALGVSPTSIDKALQALRRKAKLHGYTPAPKPLGFVPYAEPVLTPIAKTAQALGKRMLCLMDVQSKRGLDFSFLARIGQYAVDKQPDYILCIGDFADLESLSSYDVGTKSYEGRRYSLDIEAAHEAMSAFLTPIIDYNAAHPDAPYKPRMIMCLGNHEERINRAIDKDPKLAGTISIDDLQYEAFGWEVHPFLEVVVVEGVAFSHYFVTGVKGLPSSSAAAQLRVANMSCVSGHQQGKQIAYAKRADGAILTSIISGSCYEHEERYLGPQINKQHWRGFFMLHDMHDGAFDEMPVSLGFINQRYPHIKCAPDHSKEHYPEGMR